MKKNIIWIFAVILIAGLFFYFKNSDESNPNQTQNVRVPLVEVEKVSKGSISNRIFTTGSVEARQSVNIASTAEGAVDKLFKYEGDSVKKDDVILSIKRNRGIEAQLKASEEEYKKEKNNIERVKTLYENNVVSVERYEQVKVSYEKAYSAYQKNIELSEDFIIKAPFDGVIREIYSKPGQYISPRQPIVKIYSPETLIIKCFSGEKNSMDINYGLDVNVTLDAYPDKSFNGKIDKIYPYIDERTRTRSFEIKLSEDIKIIPGMFARVSIVLETHKDTLLIPQKAVFFDSKKQSSVYVVKDNQAILKKVKTNVTDNNLIQILDGLNPGENVIVKGIEDVKNKMNVKILNQNTEKENKK